MLSTYLSVVTVFQTRLGMSQEGQQPAIFVPDIRANSTAILLTSKLVSVELHKLHNLQFSATTH